jgi:hypothetical protein
MQEEIRNGIEVRDQTVATVLNLAYIEVSLLRFYLESANTCQSVRIEILSDIGRWYFAETM